MLKVICKRKNSTEIFLEDISFSEHYIVFKKKEDYGYLVLNGDMTVARLVAISFGPPHQGFKLYEDRSPTVTIQNLINMDYEVFVFTSRKEFYKFLAEHANY